MWAISDGHAGNRRQALALAEALRGGPVEEHALRTRAPWRWLAPRRWPGAMRAFGDG
ncbi:MAG TPA: nucleoside-diphosphate sugar epimerase, partial [Luteimonas sp.]|nr:nucleoside-diphosphate sugar epimerase [Luteimonas sp.]